MSDSFGLRDWIARCEKLERELAAMTATCEDYRQQACRPDECRAKVELAAFVRLLDPVDGNVVSAMVRLRDLLAVSPSHTERIICPSCAREQVATVEHKWPFNAYVHFCECGYTIMESEWERVKVKQ